MRLRFPRCLAAIALAAAVGCTPSSPPTAPANPEVRDEPTSTPSPARTPTAETTQTDTPVPPTETATPVPATATPLPPTATPRPATHSVCAAGCDFTTIQAAIDDPGTDPAASSAQGSNAIIEVRDPVHTEAGIVVSKDVTIRGLGVYSTAVQAHKTPEEAPERVFLIQEGSDVLLESMTIRHGRPSLRKECGGGILTWGTLTLRDSIVTENTANGGGGICSRGPAKLTLINSAVTGNTADGIAEHSFKCGSGGGITSGGESLTLVNTTVSDNQAGTEKVTSDPRPRSLGGGVHIGCNCTAVFTNSTVSGNKAFRDGGGVSLHGRLRLVNCTISNNTAAGLGGGIYVRGPLDYLNTIIANNGGREGDCVVDSTFMGTGSVGRNSHNLVEDKTCDPNHWGDPMLGPLADNGGDTLTHALLPGSPAIDAITAISCTVPTDQRGALRPMVQTSPETPCDIGAYEVQPGQ